MVEVEEQECALFAGAAGAIDSVLEARDQKQPVRQSGQGIVLHQIFQLGFLLPEETVGRQHAGNEERAVQHHIGRGLVDMPEQIEQVGDMAIQREEQFRQAQHPGAGGQPVQIDVAPLRATAGQDQRDGKIGRGQHVLAIDLERRQPLSVDERARQPAAVKKSDPPAEAGDRDSRSHRRSTAARRPGPHRQPDHGDQSDRGDGAADQPEIDRLLAPARTEDIGHPVERQRMGEVEQRDREKRRGKHDAVAVAGLTAQVPAEPEHHEGDRHRNEFEAGVQRQIVGGFLEQLQSRQPGPAGDQHRQRSHHQHEPTRLWTQRRGRKI